MGRVESRLLSATIDYFFIIKNERALQLDTSLVDYTFIDLFLLLLRDVLGTIKRLPLDTF